MGVRGVDKAAMILYKRCAMKATSPASSPACLDLESSHADFQFHANIMQATSAKRLRDAKVSSSPENPALLSIRGTTLVTIPTAIFNVLLARPNPTGVKRLRPLLAGEETLTSHAFEASSLPFALFGPLVSRVESSKSEWIGFTKVSVPFWSDRASPGPKAVLHKACPIPNIHKGTREPMECTRKPRCADNMSTLEAISACEIRNHGSSKSMPRGMTKLLDRIYVMLQVRI